MVKRRRINEDEDELHGSKRQNTIEEALIEDIGESSWNKFLHTLVLCMRKVVREELDLRIPPYVQPSNRPSLNHVEAFGSRGWQLVFKNGLSNILFTGSRIVAVGNKPLELVIVDAKSKDIIRTGPLSSIKVEILVLDGDFGTDEQEDWSEKEFNESIAREREGKRPLLTGELLITLNDGIGYLTDVSFTDNSSWMRSGKFKLGARPVQKSSKKERIREARSGAFVVRDSRGQGYQKHYPPSLRDEVWRLEKIRKDGVYHQRLSAMGIATVEDFLRLWVTDPSSLRTIFESGMTKKWETVIQHAKTCNLDNRRYIYSAGSELKLLFNPIYEVIGATFDGHNYLDSYTQYQMNLVEHWKQIAYKHLDEIKEINCSSASVPPVILPLEAASAPDPSLDMQFSNIQITHQDLPTHMGYNFSTYHPQLSSYGHHQLDAHIASEPVEEEFFSFRGNSSTLTGSSSKNIMIDEQLFTGYEDFTQIQIPNFSGVGTKWEQPYETILSEGNDDPGYDFLPGVSIHMNKDSKPSIGWFKVIAAVKFLCQRRRARVLNLPF